MRARWAEPELLSRVGAGAHATTMITSKIGPFIYFLNEGHPGTVIEMAEATPVRMRIFDQVREAALDWDGRDPIRMNWPQG